MLLEMADIESATKFFLYADGNILAVDKIVSVNFLLSNSAKWVSLFKICFEIRILFPRMINQAPIEMKIITILRDENANALGGLG